jgi:myo-inositol-1(or 4)-monophosphatase
MSSHRGQSPSGLAADLKFSRELAVMIAAARLAGAGLMRSFRQRDRLVVELKGPADFVTSADLESQTVLLGALSAAFPSYGFLAEEKLGGVPSSREARFVVDPLDGTSNFLHGIPHFAIAIALEQAGEVTAGVVFDPPKDEMFVAQRDRGAWLIDGTSAALPPGGPHLGALLHVSNDSDLSGALVGTGIPHANSTHRHPQYLASLAAVMREAAGVRRFAAAALDLAYVAAGRLAAFFEYGLARWDVAAGGLLVSEAGGRVSEPDGGEGYLDSGNVLATNGRLHARVQSLVAPPGAASAP